MENKAKTIKKIFIILLIVSLGILLWAKVHKPTNASKNINIAPAQTAEEADTAQKVQSFTVSGASEDGKSKWEVEGESADIFSDTVNLQAIKAKSYGGDVSVTLTADEGTFFKNTKDLELKKNVTTNTDEGTTVKSDKLKWIGESGKIITDDTVYINRQDADIQGKGAEVIPKMKKAQLNQDIKMTINPPAKNPKAGAKPPTIITCDGPLQMDYKNNVSYFNKNVIIEDQQGKIFADKVIVYINPKEKTIKKAIARGHVRITHKQNTTYSKEAIYLPDENKVILIGRPKVLIYSVDQNL